MQHFPSLWPRSGGDIGNRSRLSVPGPSRAHILRRIALHGVLPAARGTYPRSAGGMVAFDGTLRVAFRGMLYAFTNQGEMLWARDLRTYVIIPDEYARSEETDSDLPTDDDFEAIGDDYGVEYHSLPSLIGQSNTLITMSNTAALFDTHGQLVARIEVPLSDDSGLAPNCDTEGIPILTTIHGSVSRWNYTGLHEIGMFGYDIVPVAVFADNSLAIAGYSYKGFCRIHQNGTLIWQTTLKDADLLPTINQQQFSVVGSLNDRCSMIFTPDGTPIGTYPHPALFAEYHDGGWIALSEKAIARLSTSGSVQWQHTIAAPRWSRSQPLVDSNGQVYVATEQHIVAFAGNGHKVFEIELDAEPGPLFPVRAGVLATIVGDELIFVGDPMTFQ
jgi:outer membrane protein assembly factor BamB